MRMIKQTGKKDCILCAAAMVTGERVDDFLTYIHKRDDGYAVSEIVYASLMIGKPLVRLPVTDNIITRSIDYTREIFNILESYNVVVLFTDGHAVAWSYADSMIYDPHGKMYKMPSDRSIDEVLIAST